ncbi:hypothetical protein [Streptomyces scabiei]|uniref:hypothetical protein n=1 Tax=Streptomyces scabiei TaxID=1930 RepID=UPI0029A07D45|nr:hypothetical protein [Streptomyces scabiei]MDX3522375.1 hypothetical protein [Streptomyces scabiei]
MTSPHPSALPTEATEAVEQLVLRIHRGGGMTGTELAEELRGLVRLGMQHAQTRPASHTGSNIAAGHLTDMETR